MRESGLAKRRRDNPLSPWPDAPLHLPDPSLSREDGCVLPSINPFIPIFRFAVRVFTSEKECLGFYSSDISGKSEDFFSSVLNAHDLNFFSIRWHVLCACRNTLRIVVHQSRHQWKEFLPYLKAEQQKAKTRLRKYKPKKRQGK